MPLGAMERLTAVLSPDEEYAFVQIMFSSSASVRSDSYGLTRREVMKILKLKQEDEQGLNSFLKRINQAVSRYFKIVYDERRDRVVALIHVPARQARELLSSESLALLMFIFYHQEVLQNDFTLFAQLLEAFGHESLDVRRKILMNLDALIKIGAVCKYDNPSNEEAFALTAIGSRLFSDSYLKRFAEFSHSQQLNMEDVLKFFKRYNLEAGVNN
ncbi:hypothetical protein N0M98_23840 [Paenibacillus doosanensis]|uniref:Uncharacterized protein n=2 Tax=Paenibacillus TaxID=44249 RepID=A0ABY4RNU7_9BACL|nr:hypothetical protein [Paenibacillus konkukensis]MCS7463161.1 hypothetical protein [Paenibacillus doosanensis]UQZ83002.1 hypothetical protein SK3146_02162 [Paenibacillus konkukensis]